MATYQNHKRNELVSFDDINYENFDQVQQARTSMMREQWIRNEELRITHDALRKCKQYHGPDAQKNCRPLILKYMKMIETYPLQGYLHLGCKRTALLNRINSWALLGHDSLTMAA
ncbi:hypothetical protein E0198_003539 [Clavispora lusitaniae]|nr:hypothetical protein E0198_003539 [Clavispora lusitaniae]